MTRISGSKVDDRPLVSRNDREQRFSHADDERSFSVVGNPFPLTLIALAIAIAGVAKTAEARTDSQRPADGEGIAATLRLAREAEDLGDLHRAMELYQEVVEVAPSSRLAARATDRLGYLMARGEGEHGPLATLLRFRSDSEARTPEHLVAFTRELETFPPGRVRREARALVANAWLEFGNHPEEALAMFEAWSREPDIEEAERILAIGGAARAKAQQGDITGGLALLREAGLYDEPELRRMRWAAVELVALPMAWGMVVAFLLLAAFSLLRGREQWRRWFGTMSPGWLLIALWVVCVPPAMALAKDFTLVPLVPQFAAYAGGILLLAWLTGAALASSKAPRWQVRTLAVAAFCAVISAGVLAVSQSDMPDHLQLWWGI